jgi:hypothetical protein
MRKFKGLAYGISFDTQEMPGKVVAVSVALDKLIMRQTDSVRVDLCDHPLYPHLQRYVLANPVPDPKDGKQ